METQACPGSHTQEMRTVIGSALCARCAKQLDRSLRALPGLHRECLHHMSSSARRTSNPTKVSGSRQRDHLNVSALDTRHNILAVLGSWSEIVVEELGIDAPERSVSHLVRFLTDNLAWLTAQPPAKDFAEEIETLRGDLLRVIDPGHSSHRAFVAECVVDYCTGKISASPQNYANSTKSSITCSSGHSWEMREWLTLRQLMNRKREDAA